MKLIIEKDNGTRVEVSEINLLDADNNILFFFLNYRLREKDIEVIEEKLTSKIGKQCVVLDNLFASKIMGV